MDTASGRGLPWLSRFALLIAVTWALTAGQDLETTYGPEEVCQWETFSATCQPGYVLHVDEARYGRMRLGRCLAQDFGYLQCGADVLREVDAQCSGRQECTLSVTTLHGGHNCPNDLVAYLEITYSCVKVTECEPTTCPSTDFLRVTANKGLLSSYVTATSQCGAPSCPWLLEALPGQRFNFTLVDFSLGQKSAEDGVGMGVGGDGDAEVGGSTFCHRYATISEDQEISKEITSCNSDTSRERHVYLSTSNIARVSLYTHTMDENDMFLLHYEVVACPDVTAPEYSTLQRHGDSLDVRCNHGDRAWHLTCSGTTWVGEIGTCNEEDSTEAYGGYLDTSKKSPFAMLIVIGLGVALGVMLGILLLVIVFVSMRRRRRRQLLAKQRALLCEGASAESYMIKDTDMHPHPLHYPRQGGGGGCGGQTKLSMDGTVRYAPNHNYTATIQIKRPLPLPLEEQQAHMANMPLLPPDLGCGGGVGVIDAAGGVGVGDPTTCERCLAGSKDSHVYETTKRGLLGHEWTRIHSVDDMDRIKGESQVIDPRSTN